MVALIRGKRITYCQGNRFRVARAPVWRQSTGLRNQQHASTILLCSWDILQRREHVSGNESGIEAVATIIEIGKAGVELSIGYRYGIRMRGATNGMLEVMVMNQTGLRE